MGINGRKSNGLIHKHNELNQRGIVNGAENSDGDPRENTNE